jgi:hypothetical protein
MTCKLPTVGRGIIYTVYQEAATIGSTRGRHHIRPLCAEACRDILFVLDNELHVGDVTVIHPDVAWSVWDTGMRAQNQAQNQANELGRKPLFVSCCGDFWASPLWTCCPRMGTLQSPVARQQAAVGPGHPQRAQHQSLQAIACLKQGVSGVLVKASGVCLRHEESRPTAETIE